MSGKDGGPRPVPPTPAPRKSKAGTLGDQAAGKSRQGSDFPPSHSQHPQNQDRNNTGPLPSPSQPPLPGPLAPWQHHLEPGPFGDQPVPADGGSQLIIGYNMGLQLNDGHGQRPDAMALASPVETESTSQTVDSGPEGLKQDMPNKMHENQISVQRDYQHQSQPKQWNPGQKPNISPGGPSRFQPNLSPSSIQQQHFPTDTSELPYKTGDPRHSENQSVWNPSQSHQLQPGNPNQFQHPTPVLKPSQSQNQQGHAYQFQNQPFQHLHRNPNQSQYQFSSSSQFSNQPGSANFIPNQSWYLNQTQGQIANPSQFLHPSQSQNQPRNMSESQYMYYSCKPNQFQQPVMNQEGFHQSKSSTNTQFTDSRYHTQAMTQTTQIPNSNPHNTPLQHTTPVNQPGCYQQYMNSAIYQYPYPSGSARYVPPLTDQYQCQQRVDIASQENEEHVLVASNYQQRVPALNHQKSAHQFPATSFQRSHNFLQQQSSGCYQQEQPQTPQEKPPPLPPRPGRHQQPHMKHQKQYHIGQPSNVPHQYKQQSYPEHQHHHQYLGQHPYLSQHQNPDQQHQYPGQQQYSDQHQKYPNQQQYTDQHKQYPNQQQYPDQHKQYPNQQQYPDQHKQYPNQQQYPDQHKQYPNQQQYPDQHKQYPGQQQYPGGQQYSDQYQQYLGQQKHPGQPEYQDKRQQYPGQQQNLQYSDQWQHQHYAGQQQCYPGQEHRQPHPRQQHSQPDQRQPAWQFQEYPFNHQYPLQQNPWERGQYPNHTSSTFDQLHQMKAPGRNYTTSTEGQKAVRQSSHKQGKEKETGKDKKSRQTTENEPSAARQSKKPFKGKTKDAKKKRRESGIETSSSEEDEDKKKNTKYVYIKSQSRVIEQEALRYYLESRISQEPDNLLQHPDKKLAVLVTFSSPIDFRQLVKAVSKKCFGENTRLTLHEVPPPTALVVSCETGSISDLESVRLYLERVKVGGGELESDDEDEEVEPGCFVLRFKDFRVVEELCRRHPNGVKVNEQTIWLSPYYECEAGCIWDTSMHTPTLKPPKDIRIPLSHSCMQFIKRHCQSDLDAMMTTHHFGVTYVDDGLQVECQLTSDISGYNGLVENWDATVKSAITTYIDSKIEEREIAADDKIWTGLLASLNQDSPQGISTEPDDNRNILHVTGFKSNMEEAIESIQNKIEQLQNEAKRVHQQGKYDPMKLQFLQEKKVFAEIQELFPGLTIDLKDNVVWLEGTQLEVTKAFNKINEEVIALEEECVPHKRTKQWVKHVGTAPVKHFVNNLLQEQQLPGQWTVDEQFIKVVVDKDEQVHKMSQTILSEVCEDRISVSSTCNIFDQESWTDLHSKLTQSKLVDVHHVKRDSDGEMDIIIVSTAGEMSSAVTKVKCYIKDNKSIRKFIKCEMDILEYALQFWKENGTIVQLENEFSVSIKFQPGGIRVEGASQSVERAAAEINKRCDQVFRRDHLIERKDVHSVIIREKQKGTFNQIGRSCKCLISLPGGCDDTSMSSLPVSLGDSGRTADKDEDVLELPKVLTKNGIQVNIIKGDIGQQAGDVIVCCTSPTGGLNKGKVGQSLVKHGGSQLMKELAGKCPNGIEMGKIVRISGGRLRCQQVYLTVLPQWKQDSSGKTLSKVVIESLEQSHRDGMSTVVFSAMGTGSYHGYPKDKVAGLMYGAVLKFANKCQRPTIQTVQFVIHERDIEVVRAFQDVEQSQNVGENSIRFPLQISVENVKLLLDTDAIEKQKVDAILCTVSSDLNLSRGGICQALLKAGGKSLQDECTKKHGQELEPGKVVSVGPGNLSCKEVFLTVLPPYSESGKEAVVTVMKIILQLCQANKYKSLAIPALGTGYLNYPKSSTASAMYHSVIDWVLTNQRTLLKEVHFIIYSGDIETQKAFIAQHIQAQHRLNRSHRTLTSKDAGFDKAGRTVCSMTDRGCFIGDVEFKVVIGDILQVNTDGIVSGVGTSFEMQGAVAAFLLKKCPQLKSQCASKVEDLQRNDVVVTGCQGLSSKTRYIVHVKFQKTVKDWEKKLLLCLQEAENFTMRSLAFPVLGAGSGGYIFKPDEITGALFDALKSFTQIRPGSRLREIQLVIFSGNREMQDPIMSALQKKVVSGNTVSRNVLSKGLGMVKDLFGHQKHVQEPKEKPCSSLTVTILSGSQTNIDTCIQAIETELDGAYMKDEMKDFADILKELSKAQVDALLDIRTEVDVRYMPDSGIIKLYGPKNNVVTAKTEIQERIRNRERQWNKAESAEVLYGQVKWHYVEVTCDGYEKKPYDQHTNYEIEEAYKARKSHHEMRDTDGNVYVIDFEKMEEYDKKNRAGTTISVVRLDLLKAATYPSKWAPMEKGQDVHVEVLSQSTQEYKQVEKSFMKEVKNGPYQKKVSPNIQVTKISRIQNKTLHQQYEVRKHQLAKDKPEIRPHERRLWHGTDPRNIDSILTNGFNRSYSGVNGVRYGQGSYFAGCASYSAQTYLAGRQQTCYMFQVKVLTGEMCVGQRSMTTLPPSQIDSNLLMDCAVDNLKNPMEFVTFHDTQAYPEYLITYSV